MPSKNSLNRKEKLKAKDDKEGSNAVGRIVNIARDYSQAVKNETNYDYRHFFLPADLVQTRIIIVFLALTIGLFAISDYMFFNFTMIFYALTLLRIALIGYSIWQFSYIQRAKNYRKYDKSTFAYLFIVVIGILLVNLTRPQNFLPHIIIIDVAVFVFYLLTPTHFLYQALLSTIFSVGEVLIIAVNFESFMAPALFTALYSMLFANIVAALSSLQLHSYRWRIFQSVAERKETERLVAIGQTARMIGHDIRNPLQAIVSELYLAKDAITNSPHFEEQAQTLESITLIGEQTDYISKIISDLQDYARPLKPEYREVDFPELVVTIFQTVSVPENVTLKITVSGLSGLKTDPVMLRRALTNLVNNAIQAMPNGGTLKLNAIKNEAVVVIKVSDTGEGIPEDIRAKLFTPLVTTKAKGQGLGLAVVKRLVEALNGSITFDSQEGGGTTFTIIFKDFP